MLASCGGGSQTAANTSASSSSGAISVTAANGFFALNSAQVASVRQCVQALDPALPTTMAGNQAPLVVDGGPCTIDPATNRVGPINGAQDVIYTTVTICPPGYAPSSGSCQSIDHVQLDTGSVGLHILASAMDARILQQLRAVTSNGLPVNDCYAYADGWTWGILRTADVWMGGYDGTVSQGERVPGISVDIIGDPASGPISATALSTCSGNGGSPGENSVPMFGANGILGVMPTQSESALYYTCTAAGGCSPIVIAPTQEANNPVYSIAGTGDNNGIVVSLQAVGNAGAPTANGTLSFGVGTQANNAFTNTHPTTYVAAAIIPKIGGLPFTQGWITASSPYTPQSKGQQPDAIFDTGTSFLALSGSGIPNTGPSTQMWFTPNPSPLTVTAMVQGSLPNSGGNAGPLVAQYPLSFLVANETTLALQNWAFDDLAADDTSAGLIIWGAPFFFGRTMYIVDQNTTMSIPGSAVPANGPFYAY